MHIRDEITPEKAIEAMLFASPGPLYIQEIAEAGGWTKMEAERFVERLKRQLRERAIEVRKVAGAYQMFTRSEVAPYIERILQVQNKQRLTRAQMEVLAIIAYRQPMTRGDLEAVRGINSDRTLAQLVDLELVAQSGRAELPGRPFLYATTELFLEHFGLSGIEQLPELAWDETEPEAPSFSLQEAALAEEPLRSRPMQDLAEDISGPSSGLSRLLEKIRGQEARSNH